MPASPPEAIGLNLLAFIMVSWSNREGRGDLPGRVKASPDVLECHHITGAWNYLLKVRVGTTRDLERFLTDTIKAVDGDGANRDADHPVIGEGDVDGQSRARSLLIPAKSAHERRKTHNSGPRHVA